MVFDTEAAFEEAVIEKLKAYGWDDAGGVLKYPTEQQLLDNWAAILFENNKHRDCLNGAPLTPTEMQQIVEKIREKRTPVAINELINGKEIIIKRDNANDDLHVGKEVALKIFHRDEIAGGQSRYQIAQQPVFPSKSKLGHDRRGDLMLLINGMPLFHIELKKSGVPVSEAIGQIRKYAAEGVFEGLVLVGADLRRHEPRGDEVLRQSRSRRALSTRSSSSIGPTSTTIPSTSGAMW